MTETEVTTALAAFMADYYEGTLPHHDPTNKVRVFRNNVELELLVYKDYISFDKIVAREKRKHYGTAALRWICKLADRHGVCIYGRVAPFRGTGGGPAFNMDHLARWYTTHGFEVSGTGNSLRYMKRHPKE